MPVASRRRLLRLLGTGLIGGLAGCGGSQSTTTTTPPTTTATTTSEPSSATPTTPTQQASATLLPSDTGQKLIPTDGDGGDRFGSAVALSNDGTRALIGAPHDEDPTGNQAGAVYVFERADSDWQQQTTLTPENGTTGDQFGGAVALAEDTALIGARFDDDPNGKKAGSAYVFKRSNGTWHQQTKLAPDAVDPGAFFGGALALADGGTTAFITALGDTTPNGERSGAAYVYTQTDGAWNHQATLVADDGDARDFFGFAITAAGGTVLIGAVDDEDPNGTTGKRFGGAGSAYVFDRSDGEWHQQAKLAANDGDPKDNFGVAVALAEETAFVGAFTDEDPNGEGAGATYVFERTAAGWRQEAKFAPEDGDSGDGFGRAIAPVGESTRVLIGAEGDDDPNGGQAGSAYLFAKADGTWEQKMKFAAANGNKGAGFGSALTATPDGTTALIGATRDSNANGPEAGAAYVVAPE